MNNGLIAGQVHCHESSTQHLVKRRLFYTENKETTYSILIDVISEFCVLTFYGTRSLCFLEQDLSEFVDVINIIYVDSIKIVYPSKYFLFVILLPFGNLIVK